ncbi:NAD(P)/FAD-dependent oxidoreductase [Streptomyces rectiverticillatus]|uniref:NAD(P)/FAD-dependent oxidoreductase n=1 Tax=Streptomyces rectiverticillatus TaxID=173860 RepID=UPI0015C2C791|nr:FAD-dependent oxidoreductase [Streptomyces rectiverticillatus]
MVTDRTADVIVVGNGAIGLSVAIEAARRAPGLRITVVGPPARNDAASSVAGAMLGCFGEVTTAVGHHPATTAEFDVMREALDLWPAWLDELTELAGPAADALRASLTTGTFVVLGADAGPVATENFKAMHAAAMAHGEPHELLEDPSRIEGLRPAPEARAVQALHLRRETAVDARSLLTALETAAKNLNVRVVPGVVRRVVAEGARVRGVDLTDGSRHTAETVVLAAGSGSTELATGLLPPGAVPPLLFSSGLALMTDRAPVGGERPVLRTPPAPVGTPGTHVVPFPGAGGAYIGATDTVTCRPHAGPVLGTGQALMGLACAQLDQSLTSSVMRSWLYGIRSIALDRMPLVGGCGLTGLLFATGAYRSGLHASPVIARHLAGLLTDSAPAPDERFAWFAPERAPLATTTVEDSVEEAVLHAVDSTRTLRRAPLSPDEEADLAGRVRQRVLWLYDQLDEPYALSPEMIHAYGQASPQDVERLRDHLRAARLHHGLPATTADAAIRSTLP